MLTPIMSLGSRSLVNCTRWNDRSRVAARACARVVLPTPGRSSMRRWPPARRQARASFTWVDFPSSTEFTWARARSRLARRAGSRLFAAVSGMFFTYPARRTSVSESRAARRQGDGVRRAGSVATPDGKVRAARVVWAVWAMQLASKFWLSAVLAPFGDEAFYWQESRHLDWAYSDLPPLTALLIRAGESLAGHGEFGMRLAFVLLGALLPLMLRRMAARHFGAQAGDVAGTLWLLLPLGATLGLLALPDLPLLFACIGALASLDAALASDRRRDWLALGAALALAWATHYRAAMLVFAGLAFFVLAPHGHASWRRAGLWLPLAVTLLGLVPVLIFNRQHAWQGVAFQLVERHPWSFHADAFVQPLEQALACTPLLYLLLLWALWRCAKARGQGAPWDVYGIAGGVFVLGYFLLGLFADDLRFRAHWPLPGYVPALLVLPVLAQEKSLAWKRWLWRPACTLAALGTAAAFAYFLIAAWPTQTERRE